MKILFSLLISFSFIHLQANTIDTLNNGDDKKEETCTNTDTEETPAIDVQKIQTNITGAWESRTATAQLSFEFNPNGTFTKYMNDTNLSTEVNGTWEVSENGKCLLLIPQDGSTEVTTIKYIEMDELVLATDSKSTYFSKE